MKNETELVPTTGGRCGVAVVRYDYSAFRLPDTRSGIRRNIKRLRVYGRRIIHSPPTTNFRVGFFVFFFIFRSYGQWGFVLKIQGCHRLREGCRHTRIKGNAQYTRAARCIKWKKNETGKQGTCRPGVTHLDNNVCTCTHFYTYTCI